MVQVSNARGVTHDNPQVAEVVRDSWEIALC